MNISRRSDACNSENILRRNYFLFSPDPYDQNFWIILGIFQDKGLKQVTNDRE